MTTAAAGLSAEPILTTSSPTLEVWAMEPTILRARMDTLARVQEMVLAGQAHAANLEAARFEPAPLSYQRRGGEGVIEVRGDLLKVRPWYYGLMGWEATQYSELAAALRAAAADDEVEAIRLVIDSPGGQVAGVDQALEALAEVSRQKPLNATIEDSATSAAYWLACLAGTIEANPRALVGSIGVYTVFYDLSAAAQEAGVQVHVIRSGEHKGMGIPGAAITKKQIEAVQQVVDATAADFKDQVATGRELSDEQVEQVATGQYWIAPQALELGLIDAISGPGRDNDKPRRSTPKRSAPKRPPRPPTPSASGSRACRTPSRASRTLCWSNSAPGPTWPAPRPPGPMCWPTGWRPPSRKTPGSRPPWRRPRPTTRPRQRPRAARMGPIPWPMPTPTPAGRMTLWRWPASGRPAARSRWPRPWARWPARCPSCTRPLWPRAGPSTPAAATAGSNRDRRQWSAGS